MFETTNKLNKIWLKELNSRIHRVRRLNMFLRTKTYLTLKKISILELIIFINIITIVLNMNLNFNLIIVIEIYKNSNFLKKKI